MLERVGARHRSIFSKTGKYYSKRFQPRVKAGCNNVENKQVGIALRNRSRKYTATEIVKSSIKLAKPYIVMGYTPVYL